VTTEKMLGLLAEDQEVFDVVEIQVFVEFSMGEFFQFLTKNTIINKLGELEF
jgi:hypothetical protein